MTLDEIQDSINRIKLWLIPVRGVDVFHAVNNVVFDLHSAWRAKSGFLYYRDGRYRIERGPIYRDGLAFSVYECFTDKWAGTCLFILDPAAAT